MGIQELDSTALHCLDGLLKKGEGVGIKRGGSGVRRCLKFRVCHGSCL